MDRVKIGVLTCIWKRHELALEMLRHTAYAAGDDVELVVVGSEGEASEQVAMAAPPWYYLETPNDPRGSKWNAGLVTLGALGVDVVVILGSDDFASEGYFDLVRKMASTPGIEYGGLLDCYVWRGADGAACHWPGYGADSGRQGETIGSGRWFSRRILDALDWTLWPEDGRKTGLDRAAMERVASLGLVGVNAAVPMHGTAALIDVKSSQNGADIGSYSEMAEGSPVVTETQVFKHFPPQLRTKLSLVCDPVGRVKAWQPCGEPFISAVMIARNGSAYLEACLRSIRGVVDEVTVVVDSRSKDDTKDIFRVAGARVFVEDWKGFGEQRTKSLRLARGEWALVIDCDEVLEVPGNLRELAASASDDIDGITLSMDTTSNMGQTLGSVSCRLVRRQRASYKWARHNELVGIHKTIHSSAVIRTSYAGRLRGRIAAEIPDLLAEEASHPNEQHAPYYLARAYRSIGDFTSAAKWARRCIQLGAASTKGAGAYCELAHSLAAGGDFDGAIEAADEGIERHPLYADLHHVRAALTLHRWALATVTPSAYSALPQASRLELVDRLPEAVKMLGMPIRYEPRGQA